MQCNTNYTANKRNFGYLNLNVLKKYKELYPEAILGLSDHTDGHVTVLGAVALGARVVEKHFTLSKNLKGPDHKASLEPKELSQMISFVRDTEKMLGFKDKLITKSEKKTKLLVRKSLVAMNDIKKGEIFSYKNITAKRPGKGISPFKIKKFLGKKSFKNFKKDQFIK